MQPNSFRPGITHLASPFRIFFIVSGLSAALFISVWLLALTRHIELTSSLGPLGWHAHEMVFGYLGAVLAGFLLTATSNWTGQKTVGGKGLSLLLVLWLLARIVHATEFLFPGSQWLDFLFMMGVSLSTARAIVVARRWRNLSFPLLMALMAVTERLLQLSISGRIDFLWKRPSLLLAIDAVVLSIFVFGGRILPLFTKNTLSLPKPRKKGLLDFLGLAAIVALMIGHANAVRPPTESILWAIAGVLNIARLYGWGGSKTRSVPLLWILHLGWLVACLGFILIAYSQRYPGFIATTSAQHLLYIGGLGPLSLGMMVRVALGHTGREKTSTLPTTLAFALLFISAAARVWAGSDPAGLQMDFIAVAAIAWALSFLLFLLTFTPILVSPRPDGKKG